MKWFKKILQALKSWIRNWLELDNPPVYMGADLGFRESSSVVIMKRSANNVNNIVEIINFAPGTDFNVIKARIDDVCFHYKIPPKRRNIDAPREIRDLL